MDSGTFNRKWRQSHRTLANIENDTTREQVLVTLKEVSLNILIDFRQRTAMAWDPKQPLDIASAYQLTDDECLWVLAALEPPE